MTTDSTLAGEIIQISLVFYIYLTFSNSILKSIVLFAIFIVITKIIIIFALVLSERFGPRPQGDFFI